MDNFLDKILLELIKKRRSVRIFNGKKIPREDVLSIIKAGIWAPTGCNNQELRFLILEDKKEINEFLRFKPFFRNISTVVLIFCDMSLSTSQKIYCSKAGEYLPQIDSGLALGNMILYAKSKGIDSCVINLSEYHLKEDKQNLLKRVAEKIKKLLGLYCFMENSFEFYLREQLKIPKHLKIIGGVVFGYAKEYPNIETIMHAGRRVMREETDHYLIKKKQI